jgi:hypothetical protein
LSGLVCPTPLSTDFWHSRLQSSRSWPSAAASVGLSLRKLSHYDFRAEGNTDVDASYKNVLKLFAAIERQIEAFPSHAARFPNFSKEHKPLLLRVSRHFLMRVMADAFGQGAKGPIEGKLISAKYFHGRDGVGPAIDGAAKR